MSNIQKRSEAVLDLIEQMKRHCSAEGVSTLRRLEAEAERLTTEIVALVAVGNDPGVGDGYGLRLTLQEERIMRALDRAGTRGVTRDGLHEVLCHDLPECDWSQKKLVDVVICHIRRKIRMAAKPWRIETDYGRGYKLCKDGAFEAHAIGGSPNRRYAKAAA